MMVFTVKVPFDFRIASYESIGYLLSNHEPYLGDSKCYVSLLFLKI